MGGTSLVEPTSAAHVKMMYRLCNFLVGCTRSVGEESHLSHIWIDRATRDVRAIDGCSCASSSVRMTVVNVEALQGTKHDAPIMPPNDILQRIPSNMNSSSWNLRDIVDSRVVAF